MPRLSRRLLLPAGALLLAASGPSAAGLAGSQVPAAGRDAHYRVAANVAGLAPGASTAPAGHSAGRPAAASAGSAPAALRSASTPIKIFAYIGPAGLAPSKFQPIATAVAGSRAPVYGISWRFHWSTIEPADGVYDWGPIDAALSASHAVGKKAMLRVMAGVSSPAWVDNLAQTVTFPGSVIPSAHQAKLTMPVPWDKAFLAKWGAFILAFGRRYNGNPDLYSVQMAGGGMIGTMSLPTLYSMWAAAGYSDANLTGAWETIVNYYQAGFGSTPTNLDICEPLGSGHSNVMMPVAAYVFAHYPHRVYVQTNGLQASMIRAVHNVRRLIEQAALVSTGGYQMVGSLTTRPRIGPATTAFQVAITDRVGYVEVYENDLLNPSLLSALQYLANG